MRSGEGAFKANLKHHGMTVEYVMRAIAFLGLGQV